jgi:hypothetical protein
MIARSSGIMGLFYAVDGTLDYAPGPGGNTEIQDDSVLARHIFWRKIWLRDRELFKLLRRLKGLKLKDWAQHVRSKEGTNKAPVSKISG